MRLIGAKGFLALCSRAGLWLNAVLLYFYGLLRCPLNVLVWGEWMRTYCWHKGLSCWMKSALKVTLATLLQMLYYHNAAKSMFRMSTGSVPYEQNYCPALLHFCCALLIRKYYKFIGFDSSCTNYNLSHRHDLWLEHSLYLETSDHVIAHLEEKQQITLCEHEGIKKKKRKKMFRSISLVSQLVYQPIRGSVSHVQ